MEFVNRTKSTPVFYRLSKCQPSMHLDLFRHRLQRISDGTACILLSSVPSVLDEFGLEADCLMALSLFISAEEVHTYS